RHLSPYTTLFRSHDYRSTDKIHNNHRQYQEAENTMSSQTSARPEIQASDSRYFRPRRMGHVNLVVGDLDESMRFYNAVIGFEESYRVIAIRGGFLSNGNTHHDIGMVESSGPAGRGRKPGLNHLAFELETEVDLVEGYNRAIKDGMVFQRTLDHDIA